MKDELELPALPPLEDRKRKSKISMDPFVFASEFDEDSYDSYKKQYTEHVKETIGLSRDPFDVELQKHELKDLIHAITNEIKLKGTRAPYFFLPFRPQLNDYRLKVFLNRVFIEGKPASLKVIEKVVKKTDEFTLTSALKFLWSRLPNGYIVGWKSYAQFAKLEQEQNYPQRAFLDIIPQCLLSPSHASIVYDFFDLIVAIAADTKQNKMSARKISKMCGIWAFGPIKVSPKGDTSYHRGIANWLPASDAIFHLLLSFVRSMLPESPNDEYKLPRTLQNLVLSNSYPPAETVLTSRSNLVDVPLITLKVNNPSRSPIEMLHRVGKTLKFDDTNLFYTREEYILLKSLFKDYQSLPQKLSSEGKRVMDNFCMFDEDLISDGAGSNHIRFKLCSGWSSEMLQPYENWEESKGDYFTANISKTLIDDYFVWTWLASVSSEQTRIKRNIFGKTYILETEISPGYKKWVIVEEIDISRDGYDLDIELKEEKLKKLQMNIEKLEKRKSNLLEKEYRNQKKPKPKKLNKIEPPPKDTPYVYRGFPKDIPLNLAEKELPPTPPITKESLPQAGDKSGDYISLNLPKDEEQRVTLTSPPKAPQKVPPPVRQVSEGISEESNSLTISDEPDSSSSVNQDYLLIENDKTDDPMEDLRDIIERIDIEEIEHQNYSELASKVSPAVITTRPSRKEEKRGRKEEIRRKEPRIIDEPEHWSGDVYRVPGDIPESDNSFYLHRKPPSDSISKHLEGISSPSISTENSPSKVVSLSISPSQPVHVASNSTPKLESKNILKSNIFNEIENLEAELQDVLNDDASSKDFRLGVAAGTSSVYSSVMSHKIEPNEYRAKSENSPAPIDHSRIDPVTFTKSPVPNQGTPQATLQLGDGAGLSVVTPQNPRIRQPPAVRQGTSSPLSLDRKTPMQNSSEDFISPKNNPERYQAPSPQGHYPHQGYPYAPQGQPLKGNTLQTYPPQNYPPRDYPAQGYSPHANPHEYPPEGYPPEGYPPQGYPPQGYPPQGYPPQGYPPQSYPPQTYPPQSYPLQGYPPQGHPPQGYPPQSYPSPSQGARRRYHSAQAPQGYHPPPPNQAQYQQTQFLHPPSPYQGGSVHQSSYSLTRDPRSASISPRSSNSPARSQDVATPETFSQKMVANSFVPATKVNKLHGHSNKSADKKNLRDALNNGTFGI
ncbi:BA75_00596T0 [Komagataella pastoris]|uniref:Rhodopsin n=1 Tax=Komagataella pastoris TaxID=4922 RepID=A0A1B2J570_PICPA|nr:BA75_00596T0 [Komagataella pastoris]